MVDINTTHSTACVLPGIFTTQRKFPDVSASHDQTASAADSGSSGSIPEMVLVRVAYFAPPHAPGWPHLSRFRLW